MQEREWKTKYITLTEEGHILLDNVLPAQEQFQADQFNKLSMDEKIAIVRRGSHGI